MLASLVVCVWVCLGTSTLMCSAISGLVHFWSEDGFLPLDVFCAKSNAAIYFAEKQGLWMWIKYYWRKKPYKKNNVMVTRLWVDALVYLVEPLNDLEDWGEVEHSQLPSLLTGIVLKILSLWPIPKQLCSYIKNLILKLIEFIQLGSKKLLISPGKFRNISILVCYRL